MKRILAVLLILVIVFAISGCGKDKTVSDTDISSQPGTTENSSENSVTESDSKTENSKNNTITPTDDNLLNKLFIGSKYVKLYEDVVTYSLEFEDGLEGRLARVYQTNYTTTPSGENDGKFITFEGTKYYPIDDGKSVYYSAWDFEISGNEIILGNSKAKIVLLENEKIKFTYCHDDFGDEFSVNEVLSTQKN